MNILLTATILLCGSIVVYFVALVAGYVREYLQPYQPPRRGKRG
jgi:hypothetical protein